MVITDLKEVSNGAAWPIDRGRLDRYAKNALLYEGRHGEVWPELNPFLGLQPGLDPSKTFNLGDRFDRNHVDMTVNWYKRATTCFADLLCGEPFKVIADEQSTADRIITDNSLTLKTHDLVMDLIRYGTGIYKIRFDKKGIIEVINPRYWYPVVSPDNATEITAHVLAWEFKVDDVDYVREEIHEKGKITNKLFKSGGNKLQEVPLTIFDRYSKIAPEVNTGIDDFLVVPVQNILDSSGIFGMDDYSDMNDLVKELEKRLIGSVP